MALRNMRYQSDRDNSLGTLPCQILRKMPPVLIAAKSRDHLLPGLRDTSITTSSRICSPSQSAQYHYKPYLYYIRPSLAYVTIFDVVFVH